MQLRPRGWTGCWGGEFNLGIALARGKSNPHLDSPALPISQQPVKIKYRSRVFRISGRLMASERPSLLSHPSSHARTGQETRRLGSLQLGIGGAPEPVHSS